MKYLTDQILSPKDLSQKNQFPKNCARKNGLGEGSSERKKSDRDCFKKIRIQEVVLRSFMSILMLLGAQLFSSSVLASDIEPSPLLICLQQEWPSTENISKSLYDELLYSCELETSQSLNSLNIESSVLWKILEATMAGQASVMIQGEQILIPVMLSEGGKNLPGWFGGIINGKRNSRLPVIEGDRTGDLTPVEGGSGEPWPIKKKKPRQSSLGGEPVGTPLPALPPPPEELDFADFEDCIAKNIRKMNPQQAMELCEDLLKDNSSQQRVLADHQPTVLAIVASAAIVGIGQRFRWLNVFGRLFKKSKKLGAARQLSPQR